MIFTPVKNKERSWHIIKALWENFLLGKSLVPRWLYDLMYAR